MSATVTRVRWALLDSRAIAGRTLLHWAQQPGTIAVTLLFPVLILLVFGSLFGGGMAVPDGADYYDFLVPGMFAMTMLFGLESTALAVNADAAKGVTNRLRSLPIAGGAVLAGRALADMVNAVAGLAIVVVAGLAVGWSWEEGLGDALAAFGLLLLLRFAFVWVGIWLGLAIRDPQAITAVQIVVWPFGFLSSVFVSPATMPDWLGFLAEWNPLSATATAVRELFGNPGWGGDSWAAEHAVELAIAWPLVLVAVFLPLSVRTWRALGR